MSSALVALRRPIQILAPSVAERIAAGEVIERPASVVKELVENSLDAGATQIQVSLKAGGRSLIEVTDNGHGMDPESLWLASQPHATSKISLLEDLDRLSTLGFRGEALPSVSAVAELQLLSRAVEAETAYEIRLDQGPATRANEPQATTFGHFLGSPHGTQVQVIGLFSQIPARLKFLRSQAAEVSRVREWLERLAIARPGTGFRLESDSRMILNLPPADPVSRVRAVLGDAEDFPVIHETSDPDSELGVEIHWIHGLSLPHSRRLVQVVNGRAVQDRLLQQALLVGFRQALLPGQYPALALSLRVNPSELDVNVHPSKTEIRFLDSRRIFSAVGSVVAAALSRAGAPAYVAGRFQGATPSGADGSGDFTSRGFTQVAGPLSAPPSGATPFEARGWDFRSTPLLKAQEPGALSEPPSSSAPGPLAELLHDARFTGVFFNTYIAFERGEELVLVDQHAADERIRYERLRSRAERAEGPVQELLIPEVVNLSLDDAPRAAGRLAWLAELGFSAELFGDSSLLFRAVPAEWGSHSLKLRLKSLAERLLEAPDQAPGQVPGLIDEALFEKLASEACHSSVRAGDRLEDLEARTLALRLAECTHPWNCPHGRPTVVRIPRGRLEEWFQRRV